MAIHRKAERSVAALRKRLRQAMNLTVNKEDPIASSFLTIEAKLEDLKLNIIRFERWEDDLSVKFSSLEQNVHKFFFQAKQGQAVDLLRPHLLSLGQNIDELNNALQGSAPKETFWKLRDKISRHDEETSGLKLHEWRQLDVEEHILTSPVLLNLWTSYSSLDSFRSRMCFLSFSIFPENVVIKRRPLIHWWIGEGFITANESKTAEEAGEGIFKRLLELELIQPHHGTSSKPLPLPVVNACTVHPWTRFMLVSLAKKAEFLNFSPSGVPFLISRSWRACLVSGNRSLSDVNQSSFGVNAVRVDKLLTVFNLNEKYLNLESEFFRKLEKVEVIQLGRWGYSPKYHIEVVNEDFLNALGAQRHLKYLSLRGISRITVLPKFVIKLMSLEILDLKACHNLEEMPSDIGSMRKLTHLNVSDCPLLESMPKGIEKLTALQVLKGFIIGNSKRTLFTVSDLVKMKKLRRLSIYVGNEAEVKKEDFKKLGEIQSLRCLTVTWGMKSTDSKQLSVMTELSFPPSLEKLALRGIRLQSPPQELKPSKLLMLKRLYISGGKLDRLNFEETTKWRVEVLRLKYLKDFKIDRKKLLSNFPNLIYLEVKCDEITAENQNQKDKSSYEVKYKEDFVFSKREIEKDNG